MGLFNDLFFEEISQVRLHKANRTPWARDRLAQRVRKQ